MIKTNATPIAAALGLAVVGTLGLGSAQAAGNPFGLAELDGGYMQVAMSKNAEGKCGGDTSSVAEGKCGGDKSSMSEGKCGSGMKAKEGKCGEGRCGSDMKAKEGKCGASK